MLQRKAQVAPNSWMVPSRRAGTTCFLASMKASAVMPVRWPAAAAVVRTRSVSNHPGNRPFTVTPRSASLVRATPATKPVRPLRAPLDRPRTSNGAFTEPDVMLTTRPKPRSAILSTVALISSIGVSMLASRALSQASRFHSRKSPGGGPPALLTRMSTCGQAASAAARPTSVVMSPTTVRTSPPAPNARSSRAVASRTSPPRAVMTTFTPSLASAVAQPLPSPLLAAQTSAHLPLIPRSISSPPFGQQPDSREHQRRAGDDPAGERLAEDDDAHRDRRQRADHARLRRHRGADALDRHHHHQHRRKRAKRRVEHRQPHDLRRDRERRHRPQDHELGDAEQAGDAGRQAGQAQRADALDLLAAGDQIDGVAHRAREDEGGAERGVRSLQRDLVAEHEQHAAVADGERDQLAAAHATSQHDRADREHERRVEIEDE